MTKKPPTTGPRWQALPPTSMDRDERLRMLFVMEAVESIELRRCGDGVPYLHRSQISGEPILVVLDGTDDADGFSLRMQRTRTALLEACCTIDAIQRDGSKAALKVRTLARGELGDKSLTACVRSIIALGVRVQISHDASPTEGK